MTFSSISLLAAFSLTPRRRESNAGNWLKQYIRQLLAVSSGQFLIFPHHVEQGQHRFAGAVIVVCAVTTDNLQKLGQSFAVPFLGRQKAGQGVAAGDVAGIGADLGSQIRFILSGRVLLKFGGRHQ